MGNVARCQRPRWRCRLRPARRRGRRAAAVPSPAVGQDRTGVCARDRAVCHVPPDPCGSFQAGESEELAARLIKEERCPVWRSYRHGGPDRYPRFSSRTSGTRGGKVHPSPLASATSKLIDTDRDPRPDGPETNRYLAPDLIDIARLRVSMYQIASLSVRPSSICATVAVQTSSGVRVEQVRPPRGDCATRDRRDGREDQGG
jgi:hypothetical protein